MENKFFTWDNFVDGFGKEMATAEDVFSRMVKSGLVDNLKDQTKACENWKKALEFGAEDAKEMIDKYCK